MKSLLTAILTVTLLIAGGIALSSGLITPSVVWAADKADAI